MSVAAFVPPHLSQWSARAVNAFFAARLKAMHTCRQHNSREALIQ
jgi:hypothetical protein